MGRSKPDKQDKQNKTPIKNTLKKTQNITPQVATATTQSGGITTSKQEEQEKKTDPTTKFEQDPADDTYHSGHIKTDANSRSREVKNKLTPKET
jgi:hypothetical protein